MGIDFKINFSTKIKIDGKEYGSVEEVPEEHRANIRDAMNAAKEKPGQNTFVVNGVWYDSLEAMPADVRDLYKEALANAKAGTHSANPTLQPSSGNSEPEGFLSARTVTVLALLAGLAILLKLFAPK